MLFLAYSNTPKKFDILLDRMAGSHKHHDGVLFQEYFDFRELILFQAHNDAIMTFSKCVAVRLTFFFFLFVFILLFRANIIMFPL